MAEFSQPVIIGPAQGGEELAIRDAVQKQPLGGIQDIDINPVQVHIFEMFFGDIRPRADILHSVPKSQRVSIFNLKAFAGL